MFHKLFVQLKTSILTKNLEKFVCYAKKLLLFQLYSNDFHQCFLISLSGPSHSSIVRVFLKDIIIHKINSFVHKKRCLSLLHGKNCIMLGHHIFFAFKENKYFRDALEHDAILTFYQIPKITVFAS